MPFSLLSDVALKEEELKSLREELKTVNCYLQKVRELKLTARVADKQHEAETQELTEQLRQKDLLLAELQSRLAAPAPPLAFSAPLDAASCDVAGYRAVIAQLNREVVALRAAQEELKRQLRSGVSSGVDGVNSGVGGVNAMVNGVACEVNVNVSGVNGTVNQSNATANGVNGTVNQSNATANGVNGVNSSTNGVDTMNTPTINTPQPNPGDARLQTLLRSLQQALHVKSSVIARQEELLQAAIAERDALREGARKEAWNDETSGVQEPSSVINATPRDAQSVDPSLLTLPDPSLNDSLVGASTEDSLTAMDSTPVEETEINQTLQKELEATKQELQKLREEREKEREAAHEKEAQIQALREEKEIQMQEKEAHIRTLQEEKDAQIQTLLKDNETQIQSLRSHHEASQAQLVAVARTEFSQLRNALQQIEKQLAADESFTLTWLKTLSQTLSSHYALVDTRLVTQRQQIAQLRDQLQESTGRYRVMVRARPLLQMDTCRTIAVHVMNDATLQIQDATHPVKQFVFDHVFSPTASQESMFAEVEPVVMSIFRGINACVIAYGQTGSGKTYSMIGESATPGILARSCRVLFEEFQFRKDAAFSLRLSVCELYCEALRDLLNGGAEVPFSGFSASGVSWKDVNSESEVVSLLAKAAALRATAETKLNERSSRSHMLVTMLLMDGERQVAKLTLVDLAGSENLKRSGAENERKKEAQNINLSLFELTNVLRDLATPKRVPTYRNSKLTMLLRVGEGEAGHK